MIRKVVFLLVVLVFAAYAFEAADLDMLDLESVDGSVSFAEIADQLDSDDVFSQFISDDEDDERDDYDDEHAERQRRREKKEKRREIKRIRAERRAKAKLARAPVYNANNSTGAANNSTAKKSKSKRRFNKKFLDAKEKRMLDDARRFEKVARREKARAAAHGATVAALRSIHQENKLQAKIARDNGKITYELRSAVDAMNAVKNDMERDSLEDDSLFWDSFYDKKAHANVTQPTTPEVVMKAHQDAEAKFKKDMALPIYKVSHIASFEEAYGRAKHIPKLDDSLKEDGEKYLSYISLFN